MRNIALVTGASSGMGREMDSLSVPGVFFV